MYTTSSVGQHLIQEFEQCRLSAYKDLKGIVTIGWGHTGPEVHMGQTISQQEADHLFSVDLKKFEDAVNSDIHMEITQNEFDALVCLCYNIGKGAFDRSTLVKDLNSAHYAQASQDFLMWDKCNGQVVAGLLRRRKAESDLFNTK